MGQFQPNLAQSILGKRGFKFVQKKGQTLLQMAKWRNSKFLFKKVFSRTIGPISTKLGTKHSSGEGLKVCSNERPRPSPRGDNSEIVKLYFLSKSENCMPLGT